MPKQATRRHQNRGLRKVCGCARRTWAKCSHPWHFNYKPKGGPSYRFSLNSELGTHIESKGDAETAAEDIRRAIKAGAFRRRAETPAEKSVTDPSPILTLEKFGAIYEERVGKPVSVNHQTCFRQFCAFTGSATAPVTYGTRPLAVFTEDDIEVFFGQLRANGFAESTINKYVQMVKALFRWAVTKGYLTRNPAADSDVLKRRKHAQRHRRLEPDEEVKLLAHAGPHLQRLIIAALETGCRKGELLTLTWRDVNLDRREMTIRAEKSKTRTGRVIPISDRLAGTLELAKTDPAGKTFGPDAFVFGDVVGRQVGEIKRAWETCVLKAHGHKPAWTGDHSLKPESKAAFDAIDLTFHDLRHEAGSRLLEAGWPIHNVGHMLGHANISQTSTYLNATKVGLQEAMKRLDASRCKPVAKQAQIDQAPLRNGDTGEATQQTVN